jgi:hypothetical protein
VVRGIALDTRGQPIAGATVWLQPALTTGLVRTRTGADGRYEVRGLVSWFPYYAKAWADVTYHGRRYCVRLGMPNAADYDAFVPDPGAVRDFRWQLQGPIGDGAHDEMFGGEVRLFAYGEFAEGDRLELQLTPDGPLVDGSAGQVITRQVVPNDIVRGIPHGVYTARATLLGADGSRTVLRLGRSFDPRASRRRSTGSPRVRAAATAAASPAASCTGRAPDRGGRPGVGPAAAAGRAVPHPTAPPAPPARPCPRRIPSPRPVRPRL